MTKVSLTSSECSTLDSLLYRESYWVIVNFKKFLHTMCVDVGERGALINMGLSYLFFEENTPTQCFCVVTQSLRMLMGQGGEALINMGL